jgi:hypothetical protein
MESREPQLEQSATILIQIDRVDRWDVYYRLQQLSIPCWCQQGQPLEVQAYSAIAVIQIWSVIKQITASRQERLAWIKRCWQI